MLCGAAPATAATAARTSAGTECDVALTEGTGSTCGAGKAAVDADESRDDRDTSSTSDASGDSLARTDSRCATDDAPSVEEPSVEELESEAAAAGADGDPESADARRCTPAEDGVEVDATAGLPAATVDPCACARVGDAGVEEFAVIAGAEVGDEPCA